MSNLRCPIHDLPYPEGGECAVCLGARLRAADSGSSISRMWVIIGAVVVIGGGGTMWGFASLGASVHEEAVDENRFDPEEFRPQIEAIQRIVDHATLDYETSVNAVRAAEFLGDLLDAARPSVPQASPSLRLAAFQQAAGRLTLSTANERYLDRMREEWLSARESLFRDVTWFHDGSMQQQTAPVVDRAAVAAATGEVEGRMLAELAQRLETTLSTGRTRALYIDEPVSEPRSSIGLRQAREWESVTTGLAGTLEDIESDIPSNRHLSKDGQQVAYGLKRSIYELQRLLTQSGVPARAVRSNAFDAADTRLETAQSALTRMRSR